MTVTYRWSAVLVASVLGLVLSACSEQTSAAPAPSEGEGLRIAALLAGSNSGWDQAVRNGLTEEAAARGLDVTVFDAGYDPDKQFSQLQTAMASGQYNAVSVLPIVGEQMCPALQKLVGDGIPVVVMDQPACVSPTADVEKMDAGFTSFVGGDSTLAHVRSWTDYIVMNNTGKQKLLLLTGTKGSANSQVLEQAINDSIAAAGSQMEVIVADTDFTRADGFNKAETLLQSNKDISLIAGPLDPTNGAIAALAAGGLTSVKTYIYGGDATAVKQLQDGSVEMIQIGRPLTVGRATADAWATLQDGKAPEKVVFVPELEPGAPPAAVLTRDNVGSYAAEY